MSSRYTVTPVRFVSVPPAFVFDGYGNLRTTSEPSCERRTGSTRAGRTCSGGSGASFRPHPVSRERDRKKREILISWKSAYNTKRERSRSLTRPLSARSTYGRSTTIRAPAASGPAEGISARRARGARDLPEAVVREHELDAVRREKRRGLLREGVLGLGEDAQEVLVGERIERDPDRKTALQLGGREKGVERG